MTTVFILTAALLAAAMALAFFRLVRGPSALDRAVAVDTLVAIMMTAVATEAAVNRHTTSLPILAVLAVLGFTGSVAIARFTAKRRDS